MHERSDGANLTCVPRHFVGGAVLLHLLQRLAEPKVRHLAPAGAPAYQEEMSERERERARGAERGGREGAAPSDCRRPSGAGLLA